MLRKDRKQPEVCDRYFHDVPFNAKFASESADLQPMTMVSGVDGFTMKVDALYKVSPHIIPLSTYCCCEVG